MGRIFILIVAVLFLNGCQSIPLPVEQGDKLFVIVLDAVDETKEGNGKGSETIIIENNKIDFKKKYKVNGEGYIFLYNLEPGRYQILNYNNIRPSSFTSFIIKEDDEEVRYFNSKIYVAYTDKSYGNAIGSTPLKEDEIKEIPQKVITLYPEMEAWNW